LRELRHALKCRVDDGELQADFDLDAWHQTLYKNAEVRVAQFRWESTSTTTSDPDTGGASDHTNSKNTKLVSIVSRSVENAMGSVISDAVQHLIEKSQKQAAAAASMVMASNMTKTYCKNATISPPTTTSPICCNKPPMPRQRGRHTSESTLATECTMLSLSDNDDSLMEDASSSSCGGGGERERS
jgi:Tfp pilus assembly protein PilE